MNVKYETITGRSTENTDKAKLDCLNSAAEKLREWGFDLTVLSPNLVYFTLKCDGQEPVYWVTNGPYTYIRKTVPTVNDYTSDIYYSNNSSTLSSFSTSTAKEDGKTVYCATVDVVCLETSKGDIFAYIGSKSYRRGKVAIFNVGYININTLRRGKTKAVFANLGYSYASAFAVINFNGYVAFTSLELNFGANYYSSDVDGVIIRNSKVAFESTNGTTGEIERDYGTVDNIYYVEYTTTPLSPFTEYIINGDNYLTFESGRMLAL